MRNIKEKAIMEIASQIADGNTCYFDRYTAEVIVIDNAMEDKDLLLAQEKKQAEVEKKIEKYVKIEMPNKEDQMLIMQDFLEELSDKSVRKQLSNALNRKKPFRNFHQTIESDIELNIRWGNFKIKEYRRWVSDVIIVAYNY